MKPEQRDRMIRLVQEVKDTLPRTRSGEFYGASVDAALHLIEVDVALLAGVIEALLREHEGMQR